MMMRDAQDKTSEARGRLRLRSLSAVLSLGLLVALPSSPALAFELFGVKLFESDESAAIEVADPLAYTVTLDVEGSDPDGELKADLEAASQLVRRVR